MPPIQKHEMEQLIQSAVKKRERLAASTNAFRLINGQGDRLPGVTLDRFNQHFLLQIFDGRAVGWVPWLREFVLKMFQPDFFILKDRRIINANNPGQFLTHIFLSKNGAQTEVKENGMRFLVHLNDGLNNGLFLDMRRNRSEVAGLAKGKSVLNCFAYTCAFGVYCRRFLAKEVVNVDLSEKALMTGRKNYELNSIGYSQNEFIQNNCQDYLKFMGKRQTFFDMIIIDPPTFSRSRGKAFSVKKDLGGLIDLSLKLLRPRGHLFISTNYRLFSQKQLSALIEERVKSANRNLKSIEPLGADADFPGSSFSMRESFLNARLVTIG